MRLKYKFIFSILIFVIIIITTIIYSYKINEEIRLNQIKPDQINLNQVKVYDSKNGIRRTPYGEYTNNKATIFSKQVFFPDFEGNLKSIKELVKFKRENKNSFNVTFFLDNEERWARFYILPTWNRRIVTWQQVKSQYPNIEYDINLKDTWKYGVIKFDINITNGKGMGVNIPSEAGLFIGLNESKGITLNNITKTKNGLLFFDLIKLEIPSACKGAYGKKNLNLTNLNYTCLDPTFTISPYEGAYMSIGENESTDAVEDGFQVDYGGPTGSQWATILTFPLEDLPQNIVVKNASLWIWWLYSSGPPGSGGDTIYLTNSTKDGKDYSDQDDLYDSVSSSNKYYSTDQTDILNCMNTSTGDSNGWGCSYELVPKDTPITLNSNALEDIEDRALNNKNFSIGIWSPSWWGIGDQGYNTVLQFYYEDRTFPLIYFTDPTPPNDTTTTNTSIIINVTIEELNLDEVKFNWNGTNYTFYDDSLKLMYNFDNVSSLGENDTYVVDLSKYGNNGTGKNFDGDEVVSGKYGKAIEFDGIDDYIDTGGVVHDADNDKISVVAWINTRDLTTYQGIVGHRGNPSSNSGWKFVFKGDAAGDPLLFTLYEVEEHTSSGTGISANEWNFIAVTYDKSNVVFYLNGKKLSSHSQTNAVKPSTRNLYIGAINSYGTAVAFFNGSIDEFRIYDRSLSADEIYEIYVSNLRKYDVDKWNLYINQSKNATNGLDDGIYTYFASAKDIEGSENMTDVRSVNITSIDYGSVYLARHRYNKSMSASFSFDDGRWSDMRVEMLFRKYNVKGLSYIIPKRIIDNLTDEYMNEKQLKDLFDGGVIGVGSHTYNHTDLTTPGINITHQLNDTKDYLEDLLNTNITAFAYPYGSVGHETDVESVYLFGRTIVRGDTSADISNLGQVDISSYFRNTRDNEETVKSRFDTALANGGWFRNIDHSGPRDTTDSLTIEGEERWENYTRILDYINDKDCYYGTDAEIVEYFEARDSASTTSLIYNSSTNIAYFNISFTYNIKYNTPITVFVDLNENNINISVDNNLNVTIDNQRTPVYVVNSTLKQFWFEVIPKNIVQEIKIQNGTNSNLIDLTKPVITSVSSDGTKITWNTDDFADSIVYYTNDSSTPIWDWWILDRNTTRTQTHTIEIPNVDYFNNTINSSIIYYVVSSTNNRGFSSWDDNSSNYYSVDITTGDTTPPTINIVYPQNTTYTTDITELNYTCSDDSGCNSCWYSRDNGETNSSIVTAGTNFTSVTSIEGSNTWTLWCNDTSNNLAQDSVTFTKRISPNCSIVSVTPSDILANSTGIYEILINCTDSSGINTSRFIITRTVEGGDNIGIPNYWSIRPPSNDKAEEYIDVHNHNQGFILRADGRFDNKWYDVLFSDNYSYAVNDISSPKVTITNGSNWALLNFTWDVEPSVFRSSLFLSRGHIEKEDKKEYKVYKNHPLIVKGWDLMYMRNDTNYSICVFKNINYTDTPNFPLRIYYCNSTYDPSTGGNLDTSPNCAYLYSITTSDLDNIYYTSRNSSYSKSCFSVINNSLDGIKVTEISYYGYYSQVPAVKSYNIRYVNGSSGTNVSFNDSKVAWYSTDNGQNWIQANFTPDIWFSGIVSGDQLQTGVYVEDLKGNNYTNYTLYTDDIGLVNYPISTPDILWYHSQSYGFDYDLNGTHKNIMIIRVGVSKDPNNFGTVNHSLYLTYPNGSIAYTINQSFYSSLDTPLNITFNTSLVSDGIYKINVTAIADDNPNDIKSFLSHNNFTINNTIDSTPPIITVISPQPITYTTNTIDFNVSLNEVGSWCAFALDDPINTTMTKFNSTYFNYTLSSLSDGYHNVIFYCNDTSGNLAEKSVNFAVDTVPPAISLKYPLTHEYISSLHVYFNFTAIDALGIDTCELWGNWSGTWKVEDVNKTILSGNLSFFNLTLSEGTYKWNVWCNDTNGASDFSSQGNQTFTIDTTPPSLSIIYPQNTTYNINVSELNYTVSDINLQSCWYSTDGGTTNTSITCGNNVTGLTSNEGSNTWTIWANDSANQLFSDSVTFVKDTTPPQVTINYPENKTYSSSVPINFSLNEEGSCWYSTDGGTTNTSLTQYGLDHIGNKVFLNGSYTMYAYCRDEVGNQNNTEYVIFSSNTTITGLSIIIYQPLNNSIYSFASELVEVLLNVTAVAETNTSIAWYSWDNGILNKTFNITNNVSTTTYMTWDQPSSSTLIWDIMVCVNNTESLIACNYTTITVKTGKDSLRKNGGGSITTIEGYVNTTEILEEEQEEKIKTPVFIKQITDFFEWIGRKIYPANPVIGIWIFILIIILFIYRDKIKSYIKNVKLRKEWQG